eukprot:scaffold122132_cov22-Tisochrysis_lutea.AAC.4
MLMVNRVMAPPSHANFEQERKVMDISKKDIFALCRSRTCCAVAAAAAWSPERCQEQCLAGVVVKPVGAAQGGWVRDSALLASLSNQWAQHREDGSETALGCRCKTCGCNTEVGSGTAPGLHHCKTRGRYTEGMGQGQHLAGVVVEPVGVTQRGRARNSACLALL